jgi:hypothetical protein
MSQLQEAAKPILIPFLQGRWTTLGKNEQTIIAAWATMFTMVIEYAHEETIAVTQEERSFLKEHRRPPQGWHVWLGRFLGSRRQGTFWHRSLGLNVPQPPDGVTVKGNTQITIFAAGNLFVQTFSSTAPGLKIGPVRNAARSFGLQRIWPVRYFALRQPAGLISDFNFWPLMAATTAALVGKDEAAEIDKPLSVPSNPHFPF